VEADGPGFAKAWNAREGHWADLFRVNSLLPRKRCRVAVVVFAAVVAGCHAIARVQATLSPSRPGRTQTTQKQSRTDDATTTSSRQREDPRSSILCWEDRYSNWLRSIVGESASGVCVDLLARRWRVSGLQVATDVMARFCTANELLDIKRTRNTIPRKVLYLQSRTTVSKVMTVSSFSLLRFRESTSIVT
jgi:hypothetical protein